MAAAAWVRNGIRIGSDAAPVTTIWNGSTNNGIGVAREVALRIQDTTVAQFHVRITTPTGGDVIAVPLLTITTGTTIFNSTHKHSISMAKESSSTTTITVAVGIIGGAEVHRWTAASGVWTQLGSVVPDAHVSLTESVVDLSEDGNRLVMGSPFSDAATGRGSVSLFEYDGVCKWVKIKNSVSGGNDGDQLGHAVKISGLDGRQFLTSSMTANSGSGYVVSYRDQPGISTLTKTGQTLVGNSSGEEFGYSLAMNVFGNIIAVGSPGGTSTLIGGMVSGTSPVGGVYTYEFDLASNTWKQRGLPESEGRILGTTGFTRFGHAVALDRPGHRLSIGDKDNSTDSAGGGRTGQLGTHDFDSQKWVPVGAPLDGLITADEATIVSANGGTFADISGDGFLTIVMSGETRATSNNAQVGHVAYHQVSATGPQNNPPIIPFGWPIINADGGEGIVLPPEDILNGIINVEAPTVTVEEISSGPSVPPASVEAVLNSVQKSQKRLQTSFIVFTCVLGVVVLIGIIAMFLAKVLK